MEYFAGLDVATEETAICLIDGAGSIVLEATVATEPEAICKALRSVCRDCDGSAMRRDRCHPGCRRS